MITIDFMCLQYTFMNKKTFESTVSDTTSETPRLVRRQIKMPLSAGKMHDRCVQLNTQVNRQLTYFF